jgi:hypothetical protein
MDAGEERLMSRITYTAERLRAMSLEELFALLKDADAAIARKVRPEHSDLRRRRMQRPADGARRSSRRVTLH